MLQQVVGLRKMHHTKCACRMKNLIFSSQLPLEMGTLAGRSFLFFCFTTLAVAVSINGKYLLWLPGTRGVENFWQGSCFGLYSSSKCALAVALTGVGGHSALALEGLQQGHRDQNSSSAAPPQTIGILRDWRSHKPAWQNCYFPVLQEFTYSPF